MLSIAVIGYVLSVGPASKSLWDSLEDEIAAGTISSARMKRQSTYFRRYKPLFWVEDRLTPSTVSYNHTLLGRYILSFGVGDRAALGGGPG